MEKKTYLAAEMEVTYLEDTDVLTNSQPDTDVDWFNKDKAPDTDVNFDFNNG